MMKKLLITSLFSLCGTIFAFGQTPKVDIYTGATDELNFIFHNNNGGSTTQFARAAELSSGGCGGGDHYEISYASPTDAYWAGNGAFNINDWGFGAVQDYSNHTHLKLSFSWSGTPSDITLQLSLTDSNTYVEKFNPANPQTVIQRTVYKAGNIVTAGAGSDGSSGCTTVYVLLSDFVGAGTYDTTVAGDPIYPKDIDLSNIQGLNWQIGGFTWNPTPALAGAGSGTFLIDDIQVLDLTAPTITSFSVSSGVAGDSIDINGTNFNHVDNILFNTTATTGFRIISSTLIRVEIPAGATDGTITVENPKNSATSSSNFDVLAGIRTKNTFAAKIGPNPFNTNFNISTNEKIDQVIVTDFLGNVVLNGTENEINLTNAPNGLYFVTIISGDRKAVEKIVKQ